MPFEQFITRMPNSFSEHLIYMAAIIGIILLVYAVFIEKEHREDLIRSLGAGCLLSYAIYIQNTIFIIAMAAVCLASLIELIEIMFGLHKHHKEDFTRFKRLWRRRK